MAKIEKINIASRIRKRKIKIPDNDFTNNKEVMEVLKKMINCEPVSDDELIEKENNKK